MTLRQPPPSPAAVRLTRQTAVSDMADTGLQPSLTDAAARQIGQAAERHGRTTLGRIASIGHREVPPGLARAILWGHETHAAEPDPATFGLHFARPLLPHTPEQMARMLLEARDQLAEPEPPDEPAGAARGGSTSPGGWCNADGGADILPLLAHIDPRVNCTCGRRLGACTCETVWREVLPEYRAFVHSCMDALNP